MVLNGTLNIGDNVIAGFATGKIRAMFDDKGKRVKQAGPSTPVEILGLNDVPNAGEVFVGCKNDKDARNFAETFIAQNKAKLLEDDLYVSGGASVYRQLFRYADEVILSVIEGEYEGDAYLAPFEDYFVLDKVCKYVEGQVKYDKIGE